MTFRENYYDVEVFTSPSRNWRYTLLAKAKS